MFLQNQSLENFMLHLNLYCKKWKLKWGKNRFSIGSRFFGFTIFCQQSAKIPQPSAYQTPFTTTPKHVLTWHVPCCLYGTSLTFFVILFFRIQGVESDDKFAGSGIDLTVLFFETNQWTESIHSRVAICLHGGFMRCQLSRKFIFNA